MLQTLRISHFAIIDALEVSFDGGFNVVTGETGAGKSILIDALHLLLGGRAQADLVRTGHDEAAVEGEFLPLDLPTLQARLDGAGLPTCEEGRLRVRRTVHREGRSRAWVNGGGCTMAQLALVTRGLVDISGQHEHTSLMDPAGHLRLLDLYAGLGPELERYREAFDALAATDRALRALQLNEAERQRRLDYLAFQLEELEKADVKPGEEEQLRAERQRLAGAGKLRDATREAEGLLYSRDTSVGGLAQSAADLVERAAALDPTLAPIAETVRAATTQLVDAARDLGRYARGIHDDPARLEALDDRLELLRKLLRKHGGDLAQLLARQAEMQAERARLEGHEDALAEAEQARAAALAQARTLAQGLSQKRRAAARLFEQAVVERLADLEMKKTIFRLHFGAHAAGAEESIGDDALRLTREGQDAMEFLLSPNPGEEPRPLARIASGGELSRVMLAVKRVLAQRDPVETYIFDEVDAGIGGATGEVVGRLIHEVSRQRQVLCITHLPQIAAWGGSHYTVAKSVREGRTHSTVQPTEGAEGRERELARMLSGHITPASLAHARELLDKPRDAAIDARPEDDKASTRRSRRAV